MERNTIFSSLIWRLAERLGAQGVTLLVSVILARVLEPSAYGTVAIVTVIINFLGVFLDGGFGTALVQKKDADDTDFSSVFYFNIILSIFLYILLFICAKPIAHFYQNPELVAIIRVLGLSLLIFALKNVQQAYVTRNMLFKKFFFSTLGGTIGAAFVGIFMAYRGYGVWAIVAQHLLNMLVDTVILWFTVGWRPKAVFSISRLIRLVQYGWKLLFSSLLDVAYTDIRQLIIGKIYSSNDLAYYNQGSKYTQTLVLNVNSSIDSVLLPAMSNVQDQIEQVKSLTRRSIKTCTYIIFPTMAGVAACAEPIVNVIFTSKWVPCVPYMRVFCVVFAFYPVHTANLNAIKAVGRSDLFLKLETMKKVIGIIVLLLTMWYGPLIMAYSLLFTSITSQLINSWPNKKLLGYSFIEQLKDMIPQICLSLGMGIVVYAVTYLGLSDILTLLMQVPLGVAVYVVGSKVFHIDSFDYLVSVCRQFLSAKKE